MNKYKVAETIVAKILADLRQRIESGTQWDIADEQIQQEVTDKWEDIVLLELDTTPK